MKCRILLVDDNEDYLDSTRDVLEIEGYDVATAINGEQAIQMATSDNFKVIIMDIKMPGLNGVESFIEMKKNNPDINVILASAYSLEELIRKAVDEGARAVMSKPLNFGDLFDTLRDIISKKEGGIVLIADDDKALSENLEEILVKEGYQVVIAHDGEDVLRKIDNVAFDIALIDMKFPFLNGLEVYRRIKLTQPSIVAILISGYAVEMGALIEQALSEDARTFLTKPINIEKLLNTLKEIQA